LTQSDGPRSGSPETRPQLLVITGMSGAGRTTAGDTLEDLGWYVVDNLPPQLIPALAELTDSVRDTVSRVAVTVDIRARKLFTELRAAMEDVQARGIDVRVLFLDAADDVLVRRFESTRRPHPLQDGGRILDGIVRERLMLDELRGFADTVIDSSIYNVHQLSTAVAAIFGDENAPALHLNIMSFGFKYGLPLDADHVVDVRFLPNPHWVPSLRPFTGRDAEVSGYVLGQPGVDEFLDRYQAMLEPVFEGYVRENKRYATIAVGCTGGKHRSVAIAEEFGQRLAAAEVEINVVHRDLGRE
jgi:UPF0042 nucleotide-binding protein